VKKVILTIGICGSGKSFYIDEHYKGCKVISNDHIVEEYAAEYGINYSQAFHRLDRKTVVDEVNKRLDYAIKTEDVVIIDNTHMSKKVRNKYLCKFNKEWEKIAVVFKVADDVLKSRLSKREAETGKHIPENVLSDMLRSYQEPDEDEFDQVIYVTA